MTEGRNDTQRDQTSQDQTSQDRKSLSEEDRSKDEFFDKLAQLANDMVGAHGKEFTMGTLILAARFLAEGKPLTKQSGA